MYTKTATSSKQCFKGTIVFFIEDPKSTFVCSGNLFVCTFITENANAFLHEPRFSENFPENEAETIFNI